MTLLSTKNHIYEKVDNRPLSRLYRSMTCLRCGADYLQIPSNTLHGDHFCSSICERQYALEIVQAHMLGGKR